MAFFAQFPTILYDIKRERRSEYNLVTNIFFRVALVRKVLTNLSSYYSYVIKESDRPEILAEQVYNDPTAYWIILYANDIYDPQYGWPLNSRDFAKYITDKYGSVATAQTTVHHWEKVITRTESLTGVVTETRHQIDEEQLTENEIDVPYDTYATLADENSFEFINMDGRTVTEAIHREAITVFDYEDALNESKRTIRVIKPEYYPQIMAEFEKITKNKVNPFLRGFF